MKKWFYDYENKCDCSDDDRCGCTYPNNMAHNFDYVTEIAENESSVKPLKSATSAYVGGKAPDFTTAAVLENNRIDNDFNFYNYLNNGYALLLFYPADFAAVCPSELIEFSAHYTDFAERNVKIAAVSVDSVHSHRVWKNMLPADGGIGNIQIPLLSDVGKSISFDYGVLNPNGMAQRASFIVDQNYIIRYQAVFDAKIERRCYEPLHIIDILRELDKKSDACTIMSEKNFPLPPTEEQAFFGRL
jgi:peroxiredoxin (alkyl hydroperoxide reductase subunit C)